MKKYTEEEKIRHTEFMKKWIEEEKKRNTPHEVLVGEKKFDCIEKDASGLELRLPPCYGTGPGLFNCAEKYTKLLGCIYSYIPAIAEKQSKVTIVCELDLENEDGIKERKTFCINIEKEPYPYKYPDRETRYGKRRKPKKYSGGFRKGPGYGPAGRNWKTGGDCW
jgi:hypothetical protein